MQEGQHTVTIDGKDYIVEDLSDQIKYYIEQVQDLGVKMREKRKELGQLEVANRGFMDMLRASLKDQPAEAQVVQ